MRTAATPAIAAMALALGGCGAQVAARHSGSEHGVQAAKSTVAGTLALDRDNDRDNPTSSQRDKDDRPILPGGHPAAPRQLRAVASIVKRYFAAGAASDGRTACGLLYPAYVKAVPEDYGRGAGPPALKGSTCPVVMSKILAQRRRELTSKNSSLHVASVLVKGDEAAAVLRFAHTPERRLKLRAEHGAWKIDEFFDVIAVQ